jgi:hypothetical protein
MDMRTMAIRAAVIAAITVICFSLGAKSEDVKTNIKVASGAAEVRSLADYPATAASDKIQAPKSPNQRTSDTASDANRILMGCFTPGGLSPDPSALRQC